MLILHTGTVDQAWIEESGQGDCKMLDMPKVVEIITGRLLAAVETRSLQFFLLILKALTMSKLCLKYLHMSSWAH